MFGDYGAAHKQGMQFRQAGATQGLKQNQQPPGGWGSYAPSAPQQQPRMTRPQQEQQMPPQATQGLLKQFPMFQPLPIRQQIQQSPEDAARQKAMMAVWNQYLDRTPAPTPAPAPTKLDLPTLFGMNWRTLR